MSRQFAQDLAGIEDHRKALARALGVPEHAEFAAQRLALLEAREGTVDADKLVVLGDDLLRLLVKQHEVFHVVQQPFGGEKAVDYSFDAGALLLDLRAVEFFLLIVHPQPTEKMLPLGGKAANAGFQGIAEYAERVGEEQLRNALAVTHQVVVVGIAQRDIGVFQLDKY
ncbi:hypothetical protein D3C84_689270 [compost metagenome]